jgi:phosphatidylinositol alpha-1,6-mannosyltransferase
MVQKGHDVAVITAVESHMSGIKEYPVLGPSVSYWTNFFVIFKSAIVIKKIIAKQNPDVVHILVEPYASLLLFLKMEDIQTVLTVNGTFAYIPNLIHAFFKKTIGRFISWVYYKKIDDIMVISTFTKKYLLSFVPSVSEKMHLVKPGIHIGSFPTDSTQKISPSFVKEQQRVLFVGGVKKRKGIFEALQGFKIYVEEHRQDAVFDVVGSYEITHEYYKKLTSWIQNNGLSEKVFFRGRVSHEELLSYYTEADVFLMTSIMDTNGFEGFGLVYLEANAYGVPTIGSTESGATDSIVEGISGYCVDPRNPVAIAEALYSVLVKKEIRPEACIDWAEKNSSSNIVQNLLKIYTQKNEITS